MPIVRKGKLSITIYPDVSLLKRIDALERLPGGIFKAYKGNRNKQILYAVEVGLTALEIEGKSHHLHDMKGDRK